jgi:hypothetical protein
MEWEAGPLLLDTSINIISLLFSSNLLNIEIFEEVNSIPRVGDLWLSIAVVSSSHQVRFFFPGIDTLFVVGDKVVKIEHSGVESKVLMWRLGRYANGRWLWNFEHEERIQYESHQLLIRSYIVINDDPNQTLELY